MADLLPQPVETDPFSEVLLMDDKPDQEALFEIEGPDEDGCVWICPAAGRDDWCQNLGPRFVNRRWI